MGCGRCIDWCPVGIDITAEAARLAELAEWKSRGRGGMDQAGLISDFPVLARLWPGELARLSAAARPVRFGVAGTGVLRGPAAVGAG